MLKHFGTPENLTVSSASDQTFFAVASFNLIW